MPSLAMFRLVFLAIFFIAVAGFWWWAPLEPKEQAHRTLQPSSEYPGDFAEKKAQINRALKTPQVHAQSENARPPLVHEDLLPVDWLLPPETQSVEARTKLTSRVFSEGKTFLEEIQERLDSQDAEAAYWYSVYLQQCIGSARTKRMLDIRTLAYASHLREETDAAITAMTKAFERCSSLDPALDLREEALEWLTLSADLGHMAAQLSYYQNAQALLRDVAFREPQRIYEYQERARVYIQSLLQTGHPEAYAVMAIALDDGYIYEKDPQLAFAYANLASDKGFGFLGNYWSLQYGLEGQITLEEANDAKELSSEICESLSACR